MRDPLLLKLPVSSALGGLTALLGAGGITASAFIYLVPARPAWNSKHTVADFFLTGAVLGPLFAANIGAGSGRLLSLICVAAACAQLLNHALRFLRLNASDSFELRASAQLLSTVLASRFLLRGALLIAGGIALPLLSSTRVWPHCGSAGGFRRRDPGTLLFFVSVVPKNMAASYVASGKEAA